MLVSFWCRGKSLWHYSGSASFDTSIRLIHSSASMYVVPTWFQISIFLSPYILRVVWFCVKDRRLTLLPRLFVPDGMVNVRVSLQSREGMRITLARPRLSSQTSLHFSFKLSATTIYNSNIYSSYSYVWIILKSYYKKNILPYFVLFAFL